MDNERAGKGSSVIRLPDNYTVIDVETTGLSPQWDSLIEISALRFRDNELLETRSSLINPGFEIDDFITELTGITNEDLSTAPDFRSISESFYGFLGDDLLVGHNIPFDINFLYDNFLNSGLPEFSNDFINTLRFSRKLHPELKHHRLDDICSFYQCYEARDLHRSENDCLMTNAIYQELKKEAIDKFGSEDAFADQYKRHYRKVHVKDLLEMKPSVDNIDPDNPLFEKTVVFTGTLERFLRKDAQQVVVNFGGINGNTVTKKTDFLVMGNNDYCSTIKDGKSSKQKKAEALILKGQNLTILPEDVFYEMIMN